MSEQIEKHVLNQYSVVKKMGSGAYGHVWRVIEKASKKTLALKKIFDAFQHSTDAQRTYREMRVLYQLRHQNIINLDRVIRSKNDKDLYLVFGLMQADLHSAISDNILQQVHFKYITAQTLRALRYLHNAELMHRDLKPSNILLNSDCKTKICDFGLVRYFGPDDKESLAVMTEDVATRWYRAPQVLLGSRSYGPPADLWSLGCIIGEMVRGKPLFNGSNTLDQIQKIMTFTGRPTTDDLQAIKSQTAGHIITSIKAFKVKTFREWCPHASQEARSLLLGLLQFNPLKRLTASQAMRHPYLQQFYSSKEDIVVKIKPDVSDNVKLTVKDYKHLIYQWIKEHYKEAEGFDERHVSREIPRQISFKEEYDKKPRLKKSESMKADKGFMPQSYIGSGKPETSSSMQKSFSGLLKKQPYTVQSYSNNHSASKKYGSFLDKRDSRPSSGAFSAYVPEREGKSVTELLKRIEGRHRSGIGATSKSRK